MYHALSQRRAGDDGGGYAASIHEAQRDARRQETAMDVPSEFRELSAVLQSAHSWIHRYMADPCLDEEHVVTYRQVLYVALSLLAGHRTGVWRGVTVSEFKNRLRHPDGRSDITFVGGGRM